MKKITTSVVSAFLSGKPLSVSNTSTDGSNLWLFGNKIACKGSDGLYITNCGWFTATTKERLNGLPNVRIEQKKGAWYLNGNEWDGKLTKV